MKETVAVAPATGQVLPARVQEALGHLAGCAKEGLLALSVGVGLAVLGELMAEEVEDIVGPVGRHDPARAAVRHGTSAGEVTMGGRRVPVARPRVRAADGSGELALCVYEHFTSRDPLTGIVLERILAGGSMRSYRRQQEPVGQAVAKVSRSTSKSAISRMFVERTRTAYRELMARPLGDVRLAVMMLDGIHLGERTHVVALGVTTEGVKIPLGLWEGSTENTTLVRNLLADLVTRGLDPQQGILFVIDGGKALRRAIREVFGEAPVQRCQRHKERNVVEHLPERDRADLMRRLRAAWADPDPMRAMAKLQRIATQLDATYPDAARSLREGLDETLTLTRLGCHEQLRGSLQSTNPCESMIGIVRKVQRNVKHWRDGDMALRWTAAGMLEAERQFRRVVGYQHLAALVAGIERERAPSTQSEEVATLVPV